MKVKVKRNEILWMTVSNENHVPKFIITSDKLRSTYFLYSVDDNGGITKVKQSKTPTKLDEYVNNNI